MSEFSVASPAGEVSLWETELAVKLGTFNEPGFDKHTRRYNLSALERACDGWRFDEETGELTPTGNTLPHWHIDQSMQRVDPDSPSVPLGTQGLAIVASESEGHPAIIEYFDSRGMHIGRELTPYYSPRVLGSDGKMHPMQLRYISWDVDDTGRLERMRQETIWASGSIEVIGRDRAEWELLTHQIPPDK